MKLKTIFTAITLTLFSANIFAAANEVDIQVIGLFKNTAVLNINNQREVIRVGDHHKDVRLVAANSEKAMVEIGGKRVLLTMADNTPVRVGLPAAINASAHLISSGGMYTVTGSINQQLVDFVVDTGATYVTMGPEHAKRLGLDFSNAEKVITNTANGKTTAHVFMVNSIRVGGIELKNVKASVVYNLSSPKILLGMSFLNQVEMIQKNGLMTLKKSS